jgi:hypothetical protein
LTETEQQLDKFIKTLEEEKKNLKLDPSYSQFAYVTHQDLKKLSFSKKGEQVDD